MRGRIRLPMFVAAAALLGLIAVLAWLQYQWLGRISEAERDRRAAALNAQAAAFAQDFDRELTRAYFLFNLEGAREGENAAARIAGRFDRWQATARYPRMVRDFYVAQGTSAGTPALQRFNPSTRFLEPVEWPAPMAALREKMRPPQEISGTKGGTFIRTLSASLWDEVPALVLPMPVIVIPERLDDRPLRFDSIMSWAVLALDRDYISRELLPALAQQHFGSTAEADDYELAVVRTAAPEILYRSAEHFSPADGDKVDASAGLFRFRAQEFSSMASEIRRFSTLIAAHAAEGRAGPPSGATATTSRRLTIREGAPLSIFVRQGLRAEDGAAIENSAIVGGMQAAAAPAAGWRLMVRHRAGSLEAAVDATRRRNLAISSGVLAMLGISVGFLMVSTRRAQQLARQQMEFVAAVSHELRTPLAVIRSAGENLADGVVRDDEQIRKYGDLVRSEGRRLTEMVEQILEFAGIHSGQRGFVLRPVAVRPLVEEVLEASATLVDTARVKVELDFPAVLPPVLGDEPALRRVFLNLVGNAIKYGANGGWIGVRAASSGREVRISVADRGIGIAASEQARIFEPFYRTPDVIAAQIQGAGLGLSLVRRIVESHGGRIAVRSAPGAGSEFIVSLPAASEEPIARAAAGSRAAPAANPS